MAGKSNKKITQTQPTTKELVARLLEAEKEILRQGRDIQALKFHFLGTHGGNSFTTTYYEP